MGTGGAPGFPFHKSYRQCKKIKNAFRQQPRRASRIVSMPTENKMRIAVHCTWLKYDTEGPERIYESSIAEVAEGYSAIIQPGEMQ